MADGLRFDATGLGAVVAGLNNAPASALVQVRAVMSKTGMVMKDKMRAEAESDSDRFKRIQYSITYDLLDGGQGVEVGPDITLQGKWQKQGRLAHIAYYGSPTSSPAFPDPMGILEREAPVAAAFLAKAVADSL